MREWGLVGYAVAYSSTLGSALNRFAHYSRVVSDARVVRIDVERDAAWVRLDIEPALRAFRPAVDARLAALLAACREMAGAPLEFGALASSFLLRSEDLARRLAKADQTLVGYLETVEAIARAPGMSARTLQRQLRQEGTAFAKLLTDLRREMAPALLRDGRHGVSEVAFLLGYEDPSAFRRAFHRWFARSPRSYRSAAE